MEVHSLLTSVDFMKKVGKKARSTFAPPKNSGLKFKLPNPSNDEKLQKEVKESLYKAFLAKGLTFDDDLSFPDEDCPPSMNDASLEPILQKLPLSNYIVFRKFKEMTRKGEYSLLFIINDPNQGHCVQAAEDIAKRLKARGKSTQPKKAIC